jgi:hypothetical protein
MFDALQTVAAYDAEFVQRKQGGGVPFITTIPG